ncbi:MAG: transporter substrate-binding domain-containing protein, partial [Desulfobacterales bacterium]|nr:transporter substrate-binding domain-containing protein [Desulfobacterales bacterium]
MHRTILTAALLFHTILAILFISINATETQAIESDLELEKKWFCDFDGMSERHLIRALVPYSKTFYFLDGADQRGLSYELLKEFETYVNKELKRKSLRVRLVVIPTRRDRLLPALVEGLGDIAAGNLTITTTRQKQVDFSAPHLTGVDEIIITGPDSAPIQTLDDLAGKEIHVRESSSYYESLLKLNATFKNAGKP